MCGSIVDIRSATAETMRGKKGQKKNPQDKNIMSASAAQGGHNLHSSFRTARVSYTTQHRTVVIFPYPEDNHTKSRTSQLADWRGTTHSQTGQLDDAATDINNTTFC